jgi:hypothetical protein
VAHCRKIPDKPHKPSKERRVDKEPRVPAKRRFLLL